MADPEPHTSIAWKGRHRMGQQMDSLSLSALTDSNRTQSP